MWNTGIKSKSKEMESVCGGLITPPPPLRGDSPFAGESYDSR